jgi:SHS2 domain-containing protein
MVENIARKFEFIEHTADIGLVAYGTNLAEAYANAACGLFSIITEPESIREAVTRPVTITAEDYESLLFNWLNHLIYIFDVDHLLFKSFPITSLSPYQLKATCRGEHYDPSRHQLKTGVKSATYHMLEVDTEAIQVRVIFDV